MVLEDLQSLDLLHGHPLHGRHLLEVRGTLHGKTFWSVGKDVDGHENW